MRFRVLPAIVALTIGLAGCFTAEQPILTDNNSVAPYQTISFKKQGFDDVTVLTRQGKVYVSAGEEGRATLRFMPIDRPDWFVAEASSVDGAGRVLRNFAVLKVDFRSRKANAYKVFANEDDVRPGLRACGDETVCIDDLDTFIGLATVAADTGAEPDATYEFKAE